jgi:hypothetical protein
MYARLRAVAEECRLLAFQWHMLTERRDLIALDLVDDGETWRDVAEAAGFENPYIAELKRKREKLNNVRAAARKEADRG